MRASWLTHFVFVTHNVRACILDRLVRCGEQRLFGNWTKVDKSAFNNKWTKLSPCGNLFIFIVRIWAETNQLTGIYQRIHAPLSQRLKPVFLRKLVGIYSSKRFPYDVLVVDNILGWVEILEKRILSCPVTFFVYSFFFSFCFLV